MGVGKVGDFLGSKANWNSEIEQWKIGGSESEFRSISEGYFGDFRCMLPLLRIIALLVTNLLF